MLDIVTTTIALYMYISTYICMCLYIYTCIYTYIVCMHNESSNVTITSFSTMLLWIAMWASLVDLQGACWPVAMRLYGHVGFVCRFAVVLVDLWRCAFPFPGLINVCPGSLALGPGPDLRGGLENPCVNRKRPQGHKQRESKEDKCQHEWSLCRSQQTHCWHVSYYCIVYVYIDIYIYIYIYVYIGCTGVESSECSCLVEDLFSWVM